MFRRCHIGVIVLCVAAAALAQPTRGQRGSTSRPGPGGMFGRMDEWFDQLNQAYEANDRQAMGKLLEEFKQMQASRPSRPQGPGMGGMQPPGGGRGGRTSPDSSPQAQDDTEAKILTVLDDMYRNQSRGMMNVSPDDGRVLRILADSIGAKTVVEIGTSNGYSGIWFCLALRKTGGKLITHDIDRRRFDLATENFKRAGVSNCVEQVFGNAHETVDQIAGPIDILFLDADKEGYMDYLKKLLPKVRPGGLVLAHNTTNAGPQMQNYLQAVTTDKNLETVFIHQDAQGIGVTLKKR